jgi:hypothetical protein
MTQRLRELAAHRRALVAQSDVLREQVAGSAQGLKQVLGFVDLGVAAGRSIAGKPLLVVVAAAAMLVLKPRTALRLAGIALTAAPLFRQLLQILALFPSRRG